LRGRLSGVGKLLKESPAAFNDRAVVAAADAVGQFLDLLRSAADPP
jgi:hypothetical protein